MKKFKTGLLALALVFGVSAAVVAKVQATPKVLAPTYDWVDENGLNPISNQPESFAAAAYGCNDGPQLCATGRISPTSPEPGAEEVTLDKQ